MVSAGTPEVTAKVTTLEDLEGTPAGFFDTGGSSGDTALLRSAVADEIKLRKNLVPLQPVEWPALKDGPLNGVATTEIVIDCTGAVRELGSILSDNPG